MVVKNSPFGAYIATEEGSSKGLGQSSAAKAFKGDNQTDGKAPDINPNVSPTPSRSGGIETWL